MTPRQQARMVSEPSRLTGSQERRDWYYLSTADFGRHLETLRREAEVAALIVELKAVATSLRDQMASRTGDADWRRRAGQAQGFIQDKLGLAKARHVALQSSSNLSGGLDWKQYAKWNRWHVLRALEFLQAGDAARATDVLRACCEHQPLDGAPPMVSRAAERQAMAMEDRMPDSTIPPEVFARAARPVPVQRPSPACRPPKVAR